MDTKYKVIYSLNKDKFKKILSNPKIPSGAKLVLYNLIERLCGKRYCWPSQKRIAQDVGLSERQVRYHLAKLKNMGIIYWKKGSINPEKGYPIKANEYDLSRMLTPKHILTKKEENDWGNKLPE